MKKTMAAVSAVVLILSVAGTVFAYRDFFMEFKARVVDQERRIHEGIRRGELTPPEARELRDNLEYIKQEGNRVRADGLLTPREEHRLLRLLDESDRMIRQKRHNYRRAY
ncbi:MAG TPA: hypothetical protein DCZ69_14275 [Syntrophobacteraceae bacterium]|jgi:hypothetical protein|nr:hypothetical protein [Syntrophobacteraceae bacterium]HBD09418.1 hypothetical protein [Syntrophobacteraceae bacterium]